MILAKVSRVALCVRAAKTIEVGRLDRNPLDLLGKQYRGRETPERAIANRCFH